MKTDEKILDHRTRVGGQRRRKMRLRLIEAALATFDEKGLEATLIDDVISAAGVSRGTFYNYFQTIGDLLAELGTELGNDIMRAVETEVEAYPDPILRIASGLRLYLRTVSRYPSVARFFWRAGFHAVSPSHLVYDYLPRHIEEGIEQGALQVSGTEVAIDVIAGVVITSIHAASTRSVPPDYPEQMVGHILLALGVRRPSIRKLLSHNLPHVEPESDSLLASLFKH